MNERKPSFFRLDLQGVLTLGAILVHIVWFQANVDKRLTLLESHHMDQKELNVSLVKTDEKFSRIVSSIARNQSVLAALLNTKLDKEEE